MNTPFAPPIILRNPHIQTILTSLKPRKIIAGVRAAELLANSREHILQCGDGVRLLGAYSCMDGPRQGLATLIHGWEGSMDSSYILSAGAMLFRHGYDVFRLNLRDHGDSHHLNRSLFNSTRLAEAANAIAEIHRLFPHERTFLTGFSLGGNFALRIGLQAPVAGIRLTAIAVICPLINPVAATSNLENNLPLYHRYFVKKWQKSLRKKLTLHPDLGYGDTLLRLNSLTAMHDYFVPRHTDYRTTYDYLSAYRLTGDMLAKMAIPTHIIASDDDPITRKIDIDRIGQPTPLILTRTQYGGHCGYLKDLRLNSWADEQLLRVFSQACD
ncbi:MAG: alpha/beta fold hydrolase [Pseudomonadota bacterium]